MDQRIKELEEALRDEQRRREEEQRRREEEQRRREQIEATARSCNLTEFLKECHELHTSVAVVTDKSLTTQGDITNPDDRLYPKRILPWQDFDASQAAIWARIDTDTDFATRRSFPSRDNFSYERKRLRPIASETALRQFEAVAVENMAGDLFRRAREDTNVKNELGMESEISFQDHTNLGDEANLELAETMRGLRLQQEVKRSERQQTPYRHRGSADQFCILQSEIDGSRRPAVAIEYKAPHKLSMHTVSVGLKDGIDTYKDVISQGYRLSDGEKGDQWWCRYVMAATLTQLFSYMLAQGTRYGYLSTGQAYVFVRIGDDPSEVNFSVRIPSLDVSTNDPLRLHQTAVAQVFAFTVQAAREATLTQDWHRRRDRLSPWKVDLQSILQAMPQSVRTNVSCSEYIPSRSTVNSRSAIRTRAHCRPGEIDEHGSDSDQGGPGPPESPAEQRQRRMQTRNAARRARQDAQDNEKTPSEGKQVGQRDIKDQPYCSHQCLLGLAQGGDLDSLCPNSRLHGPQHLSKEDFLRSVRHQLLIDIGADARCVPLNMHGSRGGLLKVSLAAQGYTLVAKGSEISNLAHLRNEQDIYRQLRSVQGEYVPVCLGLLELEQEYHYSGARLSHLLLMSWAGSPLYAPINTPFRKHFPQLAQSALQAIHRLNVQHNDAESRNMVYNAASKQLMVIDFERSTSSCRSGETQMSGSRIIEYTTKLRKRYKSAEDELAAMLDCMRHYLQ